MIGEAQALIKAMGLVVEDEDHMAKWLAGASGLIHQPPQKQVPTPRF